MASPKIKDGYTRIVNKLLEAIYAYQFSGQEMRVILWVIRNTYGWKNRKSVMVSVRSLAKILDIPQATIGWVFRGLILRGILIRMDDEALCLNKNYEEWMPRGAGQLMLVADPQAAKVSGAADIPAVGRKKSRKTAEPRTDEFTPPKLEEVRAYCLSRNSPVDPDKFFYHFESKGWMSGRNRVNKWKAAICWWERNEFPKKNGATPTGKICPVCAKGHLPNLNAVVCDKCGPYCRVCGTQTPRLKIVPTTGGKKKAVCKDGCDSDTK